MNEKNKEKESASADCWNGGRYQTMKIYKLKEHITKEMLESVGFDFYRECKKVGLLHARRKEKNGEELYVILSWKYRPMHPYVKLIQWNEMFCEEDITPYIKDLIERGWVVC
jgi:hypothetical protein